MVNLYELEWELLKRSKVTDRAPRSIMGDKEIRHDYELLTFDKEEKKES